MDRLQKSQYILEGQVKFFKKKTICLFARSDNWQKVPKYKT